MPLLIEAPNSRAFLPGNATLSEPNNHTLTDNQNEQTLNSLRNEIASLNFRLTKKDDRIASLDTMLNTVMEGHHSQIRAY